LTDQLTAEVEKLLEGTGSRTRCVTMENFLEECEFPIDFEKKEKTVVAVGRLHPVKGFDRLLEIWKESVKDHPDWKLVIIGDGDEKQKLFDLADRLGIRDAVVFTGALDHDQVMERMQKSSVYAMTSHSEGFPFVLIEAMACGLPPVAFDVRVGPRAIIQDGQSGRLIEDGETASYVKALNEWMDREEIRSELSKNAILRAKDFSEETIMQKWLAVLEQRI
jgi:N-acetylglucosaminyldiphosphoundecaprenol N-acetyl-beta-D-mannosaminyltransferase